MPFVARPAMLAGVGTVGVSGPLDAQALPPCRVAVDALLRHRPNYVVLDLSAATTTDASVAVLGLLRRRLARHGVRLGLAGTPRVLAERLDAAQVSALYTFHPRLADAVEASAALARLGRPHAWAAGV